MSGTPKSKSTILFQDACYKHRFIRSNDLSTIVERPERLRALKVGLAAAISRIEKSQPAIVKPATADQEDTGGELAAALQKLDLLQVAQVDAVNILFSKQSLDILDNKAVKFVHGDIDGDIYLENLIKLAKESTDKIKGGCSEIPENLPQGDLYLCPESIDAIQGALGTVCEAVDLVIASRRRNSAHANGDSPLIPLNAFVAIRPPGHHCGEDSPSGFCFVNNVIVAAAHAHLHYGIKKVVIFDIDLHHGNGTQSLAWQINEETYRQQLDAEGGWPQASSGLQIYYGSLHDVLSFPCEDGKLAMVQAASVSIHGPHGQHIENVHLQQYSSDEDFWEKLYPGHYSRLLTKAEQFVMTGNEAETLVFISCGFDACEHEYPTMSRHNRRVPTSFYHRFTVDARNFANKFAEGKLISVMEGGYCDRALISGGMAHLCGLIDADSMGVEVDEKWWSVPNLTLLEKLARRKRGGRTSLGNTDEEWFNRTAAIFQSIETTITPSTSKSQVPPSSRTLRERKPASTLVSPKESPQAPRHAKVKTPPPKLSPASPSDEFIDDMQKRLESLDLGKNNRTEMQVEVNGVRKMPRVVLHVKEPEGP